MRAKASLFFGQGFGHGDPDATCSPIGGKAEGGVGSPIAGRLLEDDVPCDGLDIRGCYTLAEPLALHLRSGQSCPTSFRENFTDLRCRHSPDLEVIRSHEQISDTRPHHADDPFVKVFRLSVGHPRFQGGINHSLHAVYLFFLR